MIDYITGHLIDPKVPALKPRATGLVLMGSSPHPDI